MSVARLSAPIAGAWAIPGPGFGLGLTSEGGLPPLVVGSVVGEPPDDEVDESGSEVSGGSVNEGAQRDP